MRTFVTSQTTDSSIVDVPVLRQIQPRPFRWDDIKSAQIAIFHDRPSDTLLIHLFGRGRQSVSVPVDRYLYALVDPESEQITGIHIEGFLAQAVKEHPGEISILNHAELRGITVIEVRALQREILGSWQPLPDRGNAVRDLDATHDRKQAAMLLLNAENTHWGMLDTSAV